MAVNPLNVLKRKLTTGDDPLSKKLCLAKNITKIHILPTLPKEIIIGDWLLDLIQEGKLTSDGWKSVLEWNTEFMTAELKGKLIKLASSYIELNPLQPEQIPVIISLLENPKLDQQFQSQIKDYIQITKSVLKNLKSELNVEVVKKVFCNIKKFYKDCKKKLEFVTLFVTGDNLEIVFDFLNCEATYSLTLDLCQTVLFPVSKKSYVTQLLRTILQKDSIDSLVQEKGDNTQIILKVMSVLLTYPSGRTNKNEDFVKQFVKAFVNSYKEDSQLIFAFYITLSSALNYNQTYMNTTMQLVPIVFENDDKVKRGIFLTMLATLIENDIDVNVRLIDTPGGSSKVEVKKNFSNFLQAVMMSALKLEKKTDKLTLQIIKTVLKLDPNIVENKLPIILPQLMIRKKTNSKLEYIEMINTVFEVLFKLSRGTEFFKQILPHLRVVLEACNTEQFELLQTEDNKSKVITAKDVLPDECVFLYGKMTSELLSRQNIELFMSLQKDLDENCLEMLENGFVSPSIITLTELLCDIFCSFMIRSKMADQAIPVQIAEEFWNVFEGFLNEMKRFGKCLLKLNYNSRLTKSFLNLCIAYTKLKILNIQYSPIKLKLEIENSDGLSDILPCLNEEDWSRLIDKMAADEHVFLNELRLLKLTLIQILDSKNTDLKETMKMKVIENITEIELQNNMFTHIMYPIFNKDECKKVAPKIIDISTIDNQIIDNAAILKNRDLLNSLVYEVTKDILTKTNMKKLAKSIEKNNFDINEFLEKNPVKMLFELENEVSDESALNNSLELLKRLHLPYLEENTQLIAIITLLLTKKSTNSKKNRKTIDSILHSIFELSPKHPDLMKIFEPEFLFDFEAKLLINLLTVKKKLFILKCVLETSVKQLKNNNEKIKIIVKILLNNQKVVRQENENCFQDPVFQITCLALPIIAKEKKTITSSTHRNILSELQEKLHKSLLKSFKKINFANELDSAGNTENCDHKMATLDAVEAFSLTLCRYCETNDSAELQNLDCLWNGLGYFVDVAIDAIKSNQTDTHIENSLQLLTTVLRYMKKLESHSRFEKKDEFLASIWHAINTRLEICFSEGKFTVLESSALLMKYLAELMSVEQFSSVIVIGVLQKVSLKKPQEITNEVKNQHKIAKFIVNSILKSNITGPKCLSLTKSIAGIMKNLSSWSKSFGALNVDVACVLAVDFDIVCELVLSAKKISMDYKFMDALFIMLHSAIELIDACEIDCFVLLFEACQSILNGLVVAREEIMEDRWHCYFQCYRSLTSALCVRASINNNMDSAYQEKLAQIAHNVEKLTQQICRRKTHVSRLAAYTIGDVSAALEKETPRKQVRQHIENSISLLIQCTDSNFVMSFLKRGLAGNPGQVTMNNMYLLFKRYHKYTGNS